MMNSLKKFARLYDKIGYQPDIEAYRAQRQALSFSVVVSRGL
jgi:hypothetical protein